MVQKHQEMHILIVLTMANGFKGKTIVFQSFDDQNHMQIGQNLVMLRDILNKAKLKDLSSSVYFSVESYH